jgi:SCP-2 sterol transfer family
VLRFLSAEWVAAFDQALADVDLPAVSADDGLAVGHGVFATSVMARAESGDTVAVTLTVADGRLTMSTGASADAGAAVRMPWSDAIAFMAGSWSPTTALSAGRAQVRGDVAVLEATSRALEAVQSRLRLLGEGTEYSGLGHDTSQRQE